ncbi:MAG: hypothetical protein MMC23_003163 [Stictis urceolatum]|nr:hypothetical protein [Stictis urceolata]
MVKFHTADTTYPHPFPLVSLAYFLRYPNPYSTHVLSTDTISRSFDPETNQLTTVRLHLKQSKLPSAVLKLLPKGILNGSGRGVGGESQNFILEKSVVDVKEGWMQTETKNLQYTGVLSVIERQRYGRPAIATQAQSAAASSRPPDLIQDTKGEHTEVTTAITFLSRFTFGNYKSAAPAASSSDNESQKPGFFSSWSTSALQRTIETSGMQRTRKALIKSKEGMLVVLERMRTGGVVGAVQGMKKDGDLVAGGAEFKKTGFQGAWRREGDDIEE